MKTMTCKQLGGACDKEFKADSFKEMAEVSKSHGVEMLEKKDPAHLEALQKIMLLMQHPQAIEEWFETKQKEFDALTED